LLSLSFSLLEASVAPASAPRQLVALATASTTPAAAFGRIPPYDQRPHAFLRIGSRSVLNDGLDADNWLAALFIHPEGVDEREAAGRLFGGAQPESVLAFALTAIRGSGRRVASVISALSRRLLARDALP
jgi:hypothetical protein